MKSVSNDSDRARFPQIKERIGEDPARILATSMDPTPRIRGITELGVANAYLKVARELDCPKRVVDACEERRDYLVKEVHRRES